MTLDPDLLAILACPHCLNELRLDEPAGKLECIACHYRYAIEDGIPNMLVDDAEKPVRAAEAAG